MPFEQGTPATIPAYSYHPTTGVYLGETVADASPLEEDVYLFPANSTEIEPPAFDAQSEQAVWDGEAWTVEAKPEPQPEPDANPDPDEPQVPATVTMGQARLALFDAGLLQSVDDAIASMEGIEGERARIEWEYRPTVDRNSALVLNLAAKLSLTEQQLDDLFIAAASL